MTTREQHDAIYKDPRFLCLQARAVAAQREMEAAVKAINDEFPLPGRCWRLAGGMVAWDHLAGEQP